MYKYNVITEERLDALRKIREAERDENFKALEGVLGEDATREMRKIYSSYTEKMLIWYAGLWAPEIGGFYFSNSARDTEGFLPDIESTAQAVKFIAAECLNEKGGADNIYIPYIPERFANKIADFAYSLQDEDGYFYHPQWGKNITLTRRGRDNGWARRMIRPLGRSTKYLLPTERQGKNGEKSTLPEQFNSIEAYKEWLTSRDLSTKSYPIGNLINSIGGMIRSAGPEFVKLTVDWLNEHQRADNGLWEPQVNYASVNGLMKLGLTYPGFGATLPYPEKSFESAISAVVSDEPMTFACEIYNAWAAANGVIRCLNYAQDTKTIEKLRKTLFENAADMIRITGEKLITTACDDGSFAYFSAASGKFCPTSQGARVSPDNIREGDINGNGCSTTAPLSHMFETFGVEKPPMFTKADAEFLFELMDAKNPTKKIYKNPENN